MATFEEMKALYENRKTEKLAQYRRGTRDENKVKYLILIAYIANMPDPTTNKQAYEQYKALEYMHSIQLYANSHPDWATPLFTKVHELFGKDGSRLPIEWSEALRQLDEAFRPE